MVTTYQRSPETEGLLASEELHAEWNRALRMARGHRAALASAYGNANLTFPVFEKPVAGYLVEGLTMPNEAEREAVQLTEAEVVVLWLGMREFPGQERAIDVPSVAHALEAAQQVWAGQYFRVYQRPAAALSDATTAISKSRQYGMRHSDY